MNYNEFIEYIKNSFKELMGNHTDIQLRKIIKNNDCELDALIILEAGSTISPTIYLNDYFEDYKAGISIGDIVSKIYKLYKEYRIEGNISTELFKNFDKIKDSIVYKLVNKENNKKLLSDVPYVEYLDLAVVFYFIVNTKEIKNATALIHNSHLELWNISREELFERAKINTPRLLKYNIANMSDVIKDFIYEEIESEGSVSQELMEDMIQVEFDSEQKGIKMFVLTNDKKTNGAACILYDGVMQHFATYIDNDIYIIPSSVHEVIMVPEGQITKEELNRMVKQVNRSEVECCDVLADHVYKYILKEERIVIP